MGLKAVCGWLLLDAGGKGAYAALECVGGDITQKLVQVWLLHFLLRCTL